MRPAHAVIGLTCVSVLLFALISMPFAHTPSNAMGQTGGTQRDNKWEYAQLLSNRETNRSGITERLLDWTSASGSHQASDYLSLADKSKLKIARDNVTLFLNAVGDQGWELVSHSTNDTVTFWGESAKIADERLLNIYSFKRRK